MWKSVGVIVVWLFAQAWPAVAEPAWSKVSPGGGGSFKCVDVAVNGKVLAGSDLSGAYLRTGTGDWIRLGRRDGIDATSVECVKWKPGRADTALVGTRNGLYLSTDSARTWSSVALDEDIATAVAWKDDTVYVAGSSSASGSNLILR